MTVQQIVGDEGPTTVSGEIVADPVATDIASRYSNVSVVTIAPEDAPTTVATTDVVGGAGTIWSNGGDRIGFCSVGFPAWSPNGISAVISAGHCSSDGAYTSIATSVPTGDPAGGGAEDGSTAQVQNELGALGFSQFGGPGNTADTTEPSQALDISVIDVTNPSMGLIPGMTDWQNLEDLSASLATDITAVGKVDLEGGPVQRSGRTTGYSDGPVDAALTGEGYLRVAGSDGVERLVWGFASQQQVIPGDSGGTVLQGSTAVGIVSATFSVDGLEYTWAADLVTNLDQTGGYTAMIELEPVSIASPESGAEVAPETSVTGTGPADQIAEYVFTPAGTTVGEADWANASEAEIDAAGNFSFPGPDVVGDEFTIYVRTSDGGFNRSTPSSIDLTVVEEAETQPDAPVFTSPENGATLESLDAITGTAEPNAEVDITGDINETVTADDEGDWTVPTELQPGDYSIKATQSVDDGPVSDPATLTFTLEEATAPKPDAPVITSPEDGAVLQEIEAITGTAEPQAELTFDGTVGGGTVTAGDDGEWSVVFDDGSQPEPGEQVFTVAQTVDGVTSDTATVTFTIEEAPAPTLVPPAITEPADGATVEDPQRLGGTGEPGATVFFEGPDATSAAAPVDGQAGVGDDGTWGVPLAEDGAFLAPGDYSVTAWQELDGVTSDKTTVSFTVTQPTPEAPVWTQPTDGAEVTQGANVLRGTGVSGNEVTVYYNDVELGRVAVVDGQWQIDSMLDPCTGQQLSAVQWHNGQNSEAAIISIDVMLAPEEPSPSPSDSPTENPEPTQSPQPSERPDDKKDDENKLHPTGADFDAAGPIALGLGMVLVAGAALTVARVRSAANKR